MVTMIQMWSFIDRARRRSLGPGGARSCTLGLVIAFRLIGPGQARTDASAVTVENLASDCGVHGTFAAGVPVKVAWEVLTDYDGLPRFVTSMHSSRLEHGDFGRKHVRQEAIAKVLFVRRRMRILLEIQEVPRQRIGFRDVLGKDFRSYVGEWKISEVSGGTVVDYELAAIPRGAAARALCRKLLRDTAHEMLEAVRAEMVRRAAKAQ